MAETLGLIRGLDALTPAWRGCVLTIGNFDGVHIGHQAILAQACRRADALATRVVAMTFDPHPVAILRPDLAPAILTPLEEKCRLLRTKGAHGIIVVSVDRAFLDLAAEDFVRGILIGRLAPRAIVEGANFRFGHDRRGGVETLRAFAAEGRFEVDLVPPADVRLSEGSRRQVSSSLIREILRAGDVETAARCLDRPYALFGKVVRGEAVGRRIGFPTINVDAAGQLVPGEGVYAGVACVAGVRSAAAVSIGRRETFGGQRVIVEAFLLDAAGAFYDETARIELTRRLRDQRRFDTADELSAQIARDVEQVRALVGAALPAGGLS